MSAKLNIVNPAAPASKQRVTFLLFDVLYDYALGLLRYDESNPDIGMGMMPHSAIHEACKHYEITLPDKDRAALTKRLEQYWWTRRPYERR